MLVVVVVLDVVLTGADAPRCRSVSAAGTVSGVSKQETASLDCQVDADPSSDVHFWWTFLGTPMKSMSLFCLLLFQPLLLFRFIHNNGVSIVLNVVDTAALIVFDRCLNWNFPL